MCCNRARVLEKYTVGRTIVCYVKEGSEEGTTMEHGRVCEKNTPTCIWRVCEACNVLEYVFLHIPSCKIEFLLFFFIVFSFLR